MNRGALRKILKISIGIFVILLSFTSSFMKINQGSYSPIEYSPNNTIQSTVQEYSFNDLGITINQFIWSEKGTFQLFVNKTFDINNNGPIVLLLEFSTQGDNPDSPGYKILGEFNQHSFETSIPRWMIGSSDNHGVIKQLAIPLEGEGRLYSNYFELTIEVKNEFDAFAEGSLQILGSSKLLIGDDLLVDTFGHFSAKMYTEFLFGTTTLGGIRAKSYIQMTINNETLLSYGNYQLQFSLEIHGEVAVSLFLFDTNMQSFSMEKNQTDDYTSEITSDISPVLGVNLYTLEIAVYSENIWSSTFNISILNVYLNVEYTEKSGFGFDDLEIPFFQWPSYPVVGVIILAIWILPYSVLKYRAWKKLPGEVEINFLEDDDAINIMDPEGLSVDDQDDDIDETFEFDEDE